MPASPYGRFICAFRSRPVRSAPFLWRVIGDEADGMASCWRNPALMQLCPWSGQLIEDPTIPQSHHHTRHWHTHHTTTAPCSCKYMQCMHATTAQEKGAPSKSRRQFASLSPPRCLCFSNPHTAGRPRRQRMKQSSSSLTAGDWHTDGWL